MYTSALRTQHTNTAQVTRNLNRSKSYLYNILRNYNDRKYVSKPFVTKVGKALGLSKDKLGYWVKSMSQLHPGSHRQLVHPIHQQNGISHKAMHQRARRVRQAKARRARAKAKQRHEHNFRYHQIGHIIKLLHRLNTYNINKVEDVTFGLFRSQRR